MKKIFACSNGIEFFSNGESVLGALPKEEQPKDIVMLLMALLIGIL